MIESNNQEDQLKIDENYSEEEVDLST
eukprot:UN12279